MDAIDGELLAVFLPEARGYLVAMVGADRQKRIEAAHGLRGACAMVGLTQLAEEVSALEDHLRAGEDGEAERQKILRAITSLETGVPAEVAAPPDPEWDPDELRGLRAFFLDEAAEHLEAIVKSLTELRADAADRAPLASILRKLHTFKGSAGSVQLLELSQLAHTLEGSVIALRDRGRSLGAAELAQLQEDIDELCARVAETEREVRRGARDDDDSVPARSPLAERSRSDRRLVERRLDADAQTVRVEVERIDELMDAASELVFDRTRIVRRLQELDGCVRDVAKVRAALHAALVQIEALKAAPEITTRVSGIATELNDVLAGLVRAAQGAGEDAEGLQRTSGTLQEGIRRVRMMAVGRLFARLEAPLRELARREGKQIRFVTAGEETEIDKAVVERVAEPLLHLVRNAVAHGIEPPEVRLAFGKPPQGTLAISARHEGDAIEIRVQDDGQGIDLEGVRRALVAGHRVSEAEARELEEPALYATLFEPGVSTRLTADDLAGRGVGLDAVKDAIARLGGSVRVTSEAGRGAAFSIRLPLTTAVQQALLFKVGGQVYAVPAARVQEALSITAEDLRPGPDGLDRLAVPGPDGIRELPLVRTGALLGVPAPPGPSSRRSALVITSPLADGQTFAMTCDKVIGPREIVVRSLGPLLAALPLYAGATISGAGKVQLILDVAHLAEHARRGVHAVRPTRALGPRRILVVDDSRAIREAASLILLQGGYSVETASDGWDAWELLQDRPFDLLLTDLEMPRLDGHELIAKVRRSAELATLPVVVVSSRTAATMRGRILQSGADGFVPKPLRRKSLLDAIDAALRKP